MIGLLCVWLIPAVLIVIIASLSVATDEEWRGITVGELIQMILVTLVPLINIMFLLFVIQECWSNWNPTFPDWWNRRLFEKKEKNDV